MHKSIEHTDLTLFFDNYSLHRIGQQNFKIPSPTLDDSSYFSEWMHDHNTAGIIEQDLGMMPE